MGENVPPRNMAHRLWWTISRGKPKGAPRAGRGNQAGGQRGQRGAPRINQGPNVAACLVWQPGTNGSKADHRCDDKTESTPSPTTFAKRRETPHSKDCKHPGELESTCSCE